MNEESEKHLKEGESGWRQRSVFSALMFLIPLLSAFLYGIVGKDKFLLLSPLVISGYVVLFAWLCVRVFSKRHQPVAPPAFLLFAAFVAYGGILVGFCPIDFEAKIRVMQIGLFAGAYGLWSNELSTFRIRRIFLFVLLAFAVLISMYGLIIHFKTPESVLWGERWTDQYITGEYGEFPRLASTYICPNHFAHLLQMLLPFCLVLLFIPKAGLYLRILAGYSMLAFAPAMYFTQSRAGMLGSMAALGVTVLLMVLRRSWKWFLVLLVCAPLFGAGVLVGAWKSSEMVHRRMEPVVEFLSEAYSKGFANTSTTDFRPLTWIDTVTMIKEKPAFGFGPASYNYIYPGFREKVKAPRMISVHPHNEYLEIAAEYGLVGLGLLASVLVWGAFRLLRYLLKTEDTKNAFIAMAFVGTVCGTLVHSMVDFEMHVFQNALVFSLLAAIAVAPMCRVRRKRLAECERGAVVWWLRRSGQFAFLGIALFGLVMATQAFTSEFLRSRGEHVTSLRAFADRHRDKAEGLLRNVEIYQKQADSYRKKAEAKPAEAAALLAEAERRELKAQASQRAADKEKAKAARLKARVDKIDAKIDEEKLCRLALKWDASNWKANKALGMKLYKQRYFCLEPEKKRALAQEERALFEQAFAHNPSDAELCMRLGDVRIFLGSVDAGLELLEKAAKLRPYHDTCWFAYGVALRKAGRYEDALWTFRYFDGSEGAVIKSSPSRAAAQENVKWLERQLKRQKSGVVAEEKSSTSLSELMKAFDVDE